jgi:peptidoglycan/LPS O-acetylase OafA/YrhL
MDGSATRYHTVDHLRATMICIVMFGHAILPYVTIPRSFKDPMTHIGFDVAAVFLYAFAMPVFFVTAGFSTALVHDRKGAATLARSHFARIFLPLVAAYIVLSPLTRAAYQFARQATLSGSLQVGLDRVMMGEWLRLGKAYHLWFLASLLLFSAMAVGVRWLVVKSGYAKSIRNASRRLFTSRWRAPLLTALIALWMAPSWVIYGSDATVLPMQITLFGFFLVGWLLYLHRDLLPTFRKHAWQPVIMAIAILPIAVWSTRIHLLTPDDPKLAIGLTAGISNSLLAVFMMFGLLGIYETHFSQRSRFGTYVSDASYYIYLIHYPLLIAVAGALAITPFSAAIKYLMTVGIVVPLVIATYHYGVRATRVGAWLKGKKPAGLTGA